MSAAIKLPVCFLTVLATAFAQKPDASRADALHQLSAQMETLSHSVSRAVVQIFSTGYVINDEREPGSNAAIVTRQRATGSGVILSADGYIVTNAHVVSGARTVRVRIADESSGPDSSMQPSGNVLDAVIVGTDRETDLAVVKVVRAGLTSLQLGDSDTLRQGQLVMAFGSPLGLQNSVSMGVVSSVARQVKPDDPMIYIQTDAPINPGNSGGPLVDADGRVMGINTFILSQSGGSEGLGFAIPSNIIRSVYDQIRKEGHVHRSEIGVAAQTITPQLAAGLKLPQDWGVLFSDVAPGGPADLAGLQPGDIAIGMNGKAMQDARQMQINLYSYAVGSKLDIQVIRNGEKRIIQVATVERPGDPQRFADMVDPAKNLVSRLGILGIDLDPQVAALLPGLRKTRGVLVAARGGDAAYSGDELELGDVVYSVNTTSITDIATLRKALDALRDTDPLVLQVEREGRLLYLTLEIE
jgi:serine protease Do